jgi:hypothetical protein
MVGEGQASRKGLLRFVLENEGFDVVAEATSTLELAQGLVIHRPDVVVLDDGIDVSAVGMLREVLPTAKVVLVWPRGVAAVGADARLEPSEVMTLLGSTVGRVAGRGAVIAPPRPSSSSMDVIVVPEPEATEEPDRVEVTDVTHVTDVTDVTGVPVGPQIPSEPQEPAEPEQREPAEPEPTELQTPPGVMLEPPQLARSWSYAAPGAARARAGRRRTRLYVAAAGAALIAALVVGSILLNPPTVSIRSVSGSVGDLTLPGSGAGGTTELPGTYKGIVHVQAEGSIRIRASGDLRLRIDGAAHALAQGDVTIRGEGVVHNVTATKVRVRGNGTIRITVRDGHIRLRLQGSVTAHGKGTVRIGGQGSFLITHRPLG